MAIRGYMYAVDWAGERLHYAGEEGDALCGREIQFHYPLSAPPPWLKGKICQNCRLRLARKRQAEGGQAALF